MIDLIKKDFTDSIKTKENFLADNLKNIENICSVLTKCIKDSNKILICGNGGSAADAQHFSGELVNRFLLNRKPLPALALTTDTSILTSIGNDFGFSDVFSKQIEALGKPGDILIAISTSGNSENIIKAVEEAEKNNIRTVALLGKTGGKLKDISDYSLIVESDDTPRIQETHILLLHIFAEIIEKELFS